MIIASVICHKTTIRSRRREPKTALNKKLSERCTLCIMKLITTSILLIGASAKPTPSRHQDAKSITRLRALRKLAAHQQSKKKHNLRRTNALLDFFATPVSENTSCDGTKCDDDDICKSFMFSDDLMPHCNTQCIPQAQMEMCKETCSNTSVVSVASSPDVIQTVSITTTEDTSTSTVTAEQKKERLSMLVDEFICDECKFFQCCMDVEGTMDEMGHAGDSHSIQTGSSMGMGGTTGHAGEYASESHSHDDSEMGQSSQQQMGMMGQSNMGTMGQVEARNYGRNFGMCNSFEPDFDSMILDFDGFLPEDMDEIDMGWGTTGEDWGWPAWDGDRDADPAPAQGVSSGNSVGSSGPETAPGLTFLGQMVDSVECPDTCAKSFLCHTILHGYPNYSDVKSACDDGCLPIVSSCEEFCSQDSGMPQEACGACKFFQCCRKSSEETMPAVKQFGGDGSKFGSCQTFFPELETLFPPGGVWNGGTNDQVFEDLEDALGDLSNAFAGIEDALSGIVEEVVGDISIPEFCPGGEDSCLVDGFCDVFSATTPNFGLTSLDYEAVCSSDALYVCGPEDFEEMCATRCSSTIASVTEAEDSSEPPIELGGSVAVAEERMGLLDLPICHLCNIAKCCKTTKANESGNGFETCALGSIVSVETTGSNQSSGAAAENSDKDPGSASTDNNGVDPNQPDSAAGGTGDSYVDEDNADGNTTSEPSSGDEPSGLEQTGNVAKPADPTPEASELNDILDSGSYTSGLSAYTALASIGLLYSVLF